MQHLIDSVRRGRVGNHFRIGNCRWVERRSAPGHIERHPRKIDDASIAAVAAQVVRRAHEDAIDRTRLDAQCTEHALRVVDRVAGDLEALAAFDALLADVNAIDRARLRTLIAGDAGRQIEAMKAAIPGRHRNRQLRIFEVLGKRFALGPIGFDPRSKRDPHAVRNGVNRLDDVAHPGPDSLHFVDHWAETHFLSRCSGGERTLRILSAIRNSPQRSVMYESLPREQEL